MKPKSPRSVKQPDVKDGAWGTFRTVLPSTGQILATHKRPLAPLRRAAGEYGKLLYVLSLQANADSVIRGVCFRLMCREVASLLALLGQPTKRDFKRTCNILRAGVVRQQKRRLKKSMSAINADAVIAEHMGMNVEAMYRMIQRADQAARRRRLQRASKS